MYDNYSVHTKHLIGVNGQINHAGYIGEHLVRVGSCSGTCLGRWSWRDSISVGNGGASGLYIMEDERVASQCKGLFHSAINVRSLP